MSSMNVQAPSADSKVQNCNAPKGDKVRRDGNKIQTPRYEITVTKDEIIIRDKTNDTTSRIWGDPHLWTGDGNKYDFHEDNLTIDLKDGTKLTVVPTAKDENGAAWIDELHVMNGSDAYKAAGVHSKEGPQFTDFEGRARELDESEVDGSVIEAGDEVDDLFHGNDQGKEISQKVLDGLGGTSKNKTFNDYDSEGDSELQDLLQQLKNSKGNILALLMTLESIIERRIYLKGLEVGALEDSRDKTQSAASNGGSGANAPESQDVNRKLRDSMFGLQQLNQSKKQIGELISNISKTDHESKMNFARNSKA
ncbi:MAG: DUF1521 domain-containing protein [Planctomycetes bacterium]|nr:DUF1521 domain-containing protein [Planctomycetota bacterium]